MGNRERREIVLNLIDKEIDSITEMALRAGFKQANELLESFIGDLTGYHRNGSDEEECADRWYERAFSHYTREYRSFLYFIHCVGIGKRTLKTMLEEPDCFNEVYSEYEEYCDREDVKADSKDEIRKYIIELLEKDE